MRPPIYFLAPHVEPRGHVAVFETNIEISFTYDYSSPRPIVISQAESTSSF